MKEVLLFDPLEMLSRPDTITPTPTWEGFEAAVERMARGGDVGGEGEGSKDKEKMEGDAVEEDEDEDEEEEMEAEECGDVKATSSKRSDQRTSCES